MEATMNQFNALPVNYINVLLGMSNDAKLRVIRLLTDSLLNQNPVIEDNTQMILQKHAANDVQTSKGIRSFKELHPNVQALCGVISYPEDDLDGEKVRSEYLKNL